MSLIVSDVAARVRELCRSTGTLVGALSIAVEG